MKLASLPPVSPLLETEEALLSLLEATLLATENILRIAHPCSFHLHQHSPGLSQENMEIRTLVEHTQRLRADIRRRQATLCERDADELEEENDDILF